MGTPYHISQSVSERDKASAELQALSLITKSLAHPERTLLSVFIQQAADREIASRFFLDEVLGQNKVTISEFLADWIVLLRKGTFPVSTLNYTNKSSPVRPVVSKDLDASLQRSIWRRDGGQCSISKAHGGKKHDESLLFVFILSPILFHDRDMAQSVSLPHRLSSTWLSLC